MATRRERVILELEDNFTSGMARAAAATALLDRELNSLSGTAVQTSRDSDRVGESVKGVGDEVDKTSAKTRRGAADIDRYSGRLRLLTELAVGIGPALIPIGATAIPAVMGLAAGFTAAASAAGVALLAFNGVGDALKAIDAAQLEPTKENLAAMRDALAELGPAGADFARYLDSIEPQLESLQNTARAGLFPGVAAGIDALLTDLPQVRHLIFEISSELGQIATEAGAGLAGPRFEAFFEYLETDAAPTLHAFAAATGNVIEGLASLMVAFAPLTRDFTGGMQAMTRSFADWAAGLAETEGFKDFVDYVRDSGPQVIALIGGISDAFVGILRAAAPVGDVVLPTLTALAKALGAIANSPIGAPLFTAAAAFLALNRAVTIGDGAVRRFQTSIEGLNSTAGKLKAGGGAIAALLLVEQVAAEIVRSTDKAAPGIQQLTQSLLNLQTVQGLRGVAQDVGDLSGAIATLSDPGMAQQIGEVYDKVPLMGSAFADITPGLRGARQEARDAATTIDALDQSLAGLVSSGSTETARKTFDELAKAYGLTADEQTELLELMPQYQEALAGSANAAQLGAGANARYARQTAIAGRNAGYTAAEIRGMTDAMAEQRAEALGAFDAVTRYTQALVEARQRGEKTNAGIALSNDLTRKQRLAVIANRDAMSELISSYNSQSKAVTNNVSKYREARASLIDAAEQMGATRAEARKMVDQYMEVPKRILTDIEFRGGEEVISAIQRIKRQAEDVERDYRINFIVTQTNSVNRRFDPQVGIPAGADGMTVPGQRYPYGDKVLAFVAPGEEIITNRNGEADQFRADRAAGRIPAYANGGTAGQSGFGLGAGNNLRRSLDDQLAIAQVMQQIRDLRRSLNKDGKDKLEGLNRRIAELELRRAQKELKLAETRVQREGMQKFAERLRDRRDTLTSLGDGLSFDSLLPSEPKTVAQGVAAEVAAFRKQIRDAGGVWTKELRQWAKDMRQAAQQYDATQAAIDAETERREALVETLNEQQSQLDNLNRTMEAFGAAVASNFLNNGFGQSVTVAGTPGAQSAALAQAQSQLAVVQASGGSGSAAQASRLMQQIALLQQGADAETAGRELTGLDALRHTLAVDEENATAFTAALQQLVSQGLDPLSGFYRELAQSGDLLTAQQLVAAGPGGIDELETLWQRRDAATAQLSAQTVQDAFGEQHAQMQAMADATRAAIAATDVTLTVLNAELAVLGEHVRVGAESGAALLEPQLRDIKNAIDALPRNLRQLIRQGGK